MSSENREGYYRLLTEKICEIQQDLRKENRERRTGARSGNGSHLMNAENAASFLADTRKRQLIQQQDGYSFLGRFAT